MSEHTAIEWTDHTFNPWWGCHKVSPGCSNCYAETLSNRFGKNIWGPPHATDRRLFGDKHWAEPLAWNARAEREGRRYRVFCASMADVFEDHPQVADERARLWQLIEVTPRLDWQLLTKRPENVAAMLPTGWTSGELPPNVWVGVSVEDQQRADERIPMLLDIPAAVKFLSVEPLLGPVTLKPEWIDLELQAFGAHGAATFPRVDWIIVGGESGPGARPMHPQWARDLRDQAVAAEVPFLFKQWGEHRPLQEGDAFPDPRVVMVARQPGPVPYPAAMLRVGKKAAGRGLDGRTWDEFPEAEAADA